MNHNIFCLPFCQLGFQGNLWLRKDSGCSRAIVPDDKLVCCFMFLPPDTPDISALPLFQLPNFSKRCVEESSAKREAHSLHFWVRSPFWIFWSFRWFNIQTAQSGRCDAILPFGSPAPFLVFWAGFWQMLKAGILNYP